MKNILLSMFAVCALMFSSLAFSWELPKQSVKFTAERSGLMPALGGEDDFILVPTTNIGFDVANASNFGLGFSYDFMFANLKMADATNVTCSPYLGVGPTFYFNNLGDWLTSQASIPLSATLGLNIIGPQIQGFPSVGVLLGFQTDNGAKVFKANLNFPLLVFPNDTIKKL